MEQSATNGTMLGMKTFDSFPVPSTLAILHLPFSTCKLQQRIEVGVEGGLSGAAVTGRM